MEGKVSLERKLEIYRESMRGLAKKSDRARGGGDPAKAHEHADDILVQLVGLLADEASNNMATTVVRDVVTEIISAYWSVHKWYS